MLLSLKRVPQQCEHGIERRIEGLVHPENRVVPLGESRIGGAFPRDFDGLGGLRQVIEQTNPDAGGKRRAERGRIGRSSGERPDGDAADVRQKLLPQIGLPD